MRTYRMQAAFARKREADLMRFEKNSEINRYFDHWGRVTSKYEAWTAPEYYRNVEENLKKENNEKLKKQQLERRREKLREILNNENIKYEEELQTIRTPRTKRISTNILHKLDQNLKEQEDNRRRLELEAKLYGKLRYGMADETSLYDSARNDHQVLAKLNWLDKQIENQLEKEKEEKETEELKLRYEEEARKREEFLKERQLIRESEIKELRTIQETNITALKERENESDLLQQQENQLKKNLNDMENEIKSFLNRKIERKLNITIPHNVKRIKMILRQCSEKYRQDLKDDINVLKRISYFTNIYDENINNLIEKYKTSHDFEIQKKSQIEAMYESEAKHNLEKWQEIWTQDDENREKQILCLLEEQKNLIKDKISNNLKQQKHLVEIRETHLNAIENANEKLKMLIKEEENYTKELKMKQKHQQNKNSDINKQKQHRTDEFRVESKSEFVSTLGPNGKSSPVTSLVSSALCSPSSSSSSCSISKHNRRHNNNEDDVNDGISNVVDTEKELLQGISSCSINGKTDKDDCSSGGGGGGSSSNSRNSSASVGPKFGRKKVAWT